MGTQDAVDEVAGLSPAVVPVSRPVGEDAAPTVAVRRVGVCVTKVEGVVGPHSPGVGVETSPDDRQAETVVLHGGVTTRPALADLPGLVRVGHDVVV